MDELYRIFFDDLDKVDKRIEGIVSNEKDLIKEITTHLPINSGKRIRSLLLLIVSKAYGRRDDVYITCSSIIELIHFASLLHDDVIDESLKRRSKKCPHTIWGEKSSILVGDFLFVKAFQLIIDLNISSITDIFLQVATNMTLGVVIELEYRNCVIDVERYNNIIISKTAELFRASCKIGAMINGCSSEVIEKIGEFGLLLGIIFQITDDMLDYHAHCGTVLYKDVGNDFLEGSVTLPIILLLEEVKNESEHDRLCKIFNSSSKNMDDFTFVVELLQRYNIYENVKVILDGHYVKALSILNSLFKEDLEYYRHLKVILDYCINRVNI